MDANFIMNNIDAYNKEELEEAKEKAKICEEQILEKYRSKGDYKIATSEKARKYASLLGYRTESISIRYKYYYRERKYRYVKELDSSTTTVTIDPMYLNDARVTIDSDDDIHIKGYSSSATGKSTVNYNYKTVKQYYYELKVGEKYYDKYIMIKNILPNTRSELDKLEQEFLSGVEKYVFCLETEKPKEIKNSKTLRLIALLEFLVPVFTMILMLVFPLLNT